MPAVVMTGRVGQSTAAAVARVPGKGGKGRTQIKSRVAAQAQSTEKRTRIASPPSQRSVQEPRKPESPPVDPRLVPTLPYAAGLAEWWTKARITISAADERLAALRQGGGE